MSPYESSADSTRSSRKRVSRSLRGSNSSATDAFTGLEPRPQPPTHNVPSTPAQRASTRPEAGPPAPLSWQPPLPIADQSVSMIANHPPFLHHSHYRPPAPSFTGPPIPPPPVPNWCPAPPPLPHPLLASQQHLRLPDTTSQHRASNRSFGFTVQNHIYPQNSDSLPPSDVYRPAPQYTLHTNSQLTPTTPRHTLASASMPPASSNEMFRGARDFVMNNPQFNNGYRAGDGLEKLFKNSMPNAFHDSGARYPPPKCHLGTRKEYIAQIEEWALGESNHQEPVLWVDGPFGIGKSALAQSCAEALKANGILIATLFFSRSYPDRDDPQRVFTSIALQIATQCKSFSDIIETRVQADPTFATKSPSAQFDELLVTPLNHIDIAGNGLNGRVVIIDGLDECHGTREQCDIIKIIANSALHRTTPFRWVITSRPEDLIVRTMNSPPISSLVFKISLPVSDKIDHEILLYLTDELTKTRETHGLPDSWPPEEVLALLVKRAAGLWIYVATIVRFINDENSFGPEDQLRVVLEFAEDMSTRSGPSNPLAEMDFFYTLIMRRVPSNIRKTVQKILLFSDPLYNNQIMSALFLSGDQFRRACATISSVMKVEDDVLTFYHASFMDFMKAPDRSKELCIHGVVLDETRAELLDWLHKACSSDQALPGHYPKSFHDTYDCIVLVFWLLCGISQCPVSPDTAASLQNLPFRRMLGHMPTSWDMDSAKIRENLPVQFRDRILRRGRCPVAGCLSDYQTWILGCGENETRVEGDDDDDIVWLTNNQNPAPGECFCGGKLQDPSLEL